MPVMCKLCEVVYSTPSSLNRHVREVHNLVPENCSLGEDSKWSHRCLELNCENVFNSNKELMLHLEKMHLIQFNLQTFHMKTLNEFVSWKSKMECSTNARYVLKSKCLLKSGVSGKVLGEVFYYNCNRSKKTYTPKSMEKRIGHQKSQGSCKMNTSCTSQIRMLKQNDEFIVEWQNVHYGHDMDLQNVEKQHVASQLLKGVTSKRTLESVHDNIGEKRKRVSLTPKDIANIRNSFIIELRKHIHCSNDLCDQESSGLAKNPVLLNKPQGTERAILKKEVQQTEGKKSCESKTLNHQLGNNMGNLIIDLTDPQDTSSSPSEIKLKDQVKTLVTKLEDLNYKNIDDSIVRQLHSHLSIMNNLLKCPQINPRNE